MTRTAVAHPIVAALRAADRILGPDRVWRAANERQGRFVDEWLGPGRADLDRIPEIESIASWETAEVNAFLEARRFALRLRSLAPRQFGAAGVLDLRCRWQHPGASTVVEAPVGRTFPAARLTPPGLAFWTAAGHPDPVAVATTMDGDTAALTPLAGAPDDFDLVALVDALERGLRPIAPAETFGGLVFPMVDLDEQAELPWLEGLRTDALDGGQADVGYAAQQTKLRLNHLSARVQSAATMAVAAGITLPPRPDYVIDRPFLLWFRRPGLALPLAVFHLTEDVWRDPGSL